MLAVHIGAGNIGRGFIGLLLHQAGYDLILTDVNPGLIDQINTAGEWQVHEVGPGGTTHHVAGVTAINSQTDAEAAIAAMARADVITTAVGASVLRHIAPAIGAALDQRDPGLPPALIMACENAIRATDQLQTEVGTHTDHLDRAIWANTAVDRIVPAQSTASLDVNVEPYFEWAIELPETQRPTIPGATFVDDLGPYIERKLFTVNTGHCTVAWLGQQRGYKRIAEAMADPEVKGELEAVLGETSALLDAKYAEITADTQAAYVQKIMGRFANPELPDTVERVGRSPLRKLGANERFISPITQAAERGLATDALLRVVAAGLDFRADSDNEVEELQHIVGRLAPEAVVETVMGVAPGAPAFDGLVHAVRRFQ